MIKNTTNVAKRNIMDLDPNLRASAREKARARVIARVRARVRARARVKARARVSAKARANPRANPRVDPDPNVVKKLDIKNITDIINIMNITITNTMSIKKCCVITGPMNGSRLMLRHIWKSKLWIKMPHQPLPWIQGL